MTFTILLTAAKLREEKEWLKCFFRTRLENPSDAKDHVEFTQAEDVFVLRCESCGTLLRNPQPTPEALAQRYRSDQYGKSVLDQLHNSELEFFERKAAWLGDLLPKGARVLEVGSFVGAFLRAAERRGWNPAGLDIGEETAAYTRSLGHQVFDQPMERLEPGWDAVCIWNTFDQLSDPAGTLGQVRRLLKPGGLLVLRVPNGAFKSMAAIHKGEKALLLQAYNNHLGFPYLTGYTPSSLTQLVYSFNFKSLRTQGDVIVSLEMQSSTELARAEEQYFKRLTLRACGAYAVATGKIVHPWFDLIARLD